jgi:hypothetical protein
MRRKALLCLAAGAAAAGLAIGFWPRELTAQPSRKTPVEAAKAQAPNLPIAGVVLFSSGVGYYQREGEVEGHARIDLTFPVQDINDLLKSMVLQDLGGGHISAVSYDSQDPIEKTLKSFAINLTNNPTYGTILQQARGEKVEVTMQQSATTQPALLTGTIVGVEKQRVTTGPNAFVDHDMLNLLCADGMRCCKMTEVQKVRFLNPVMDNELKRALEVLALSHDSQKKAVSINFSGEGRRPVRVGYVTEAPIWKTSYRLVLEPPPPPLRKGGRNEGGDGSPPPLGKGGQGGLSPEAKPFLQGWAVVENTTDNDWNNVRMSLVSGRPISFRMDLYAPLYVARPQVEPELFASLRPPTYNAAVESRLGVPPAPRSAAPAADAARMRGGAGRSAGFGGGGPGAPGGGGGGFGYAPGVPAGEAAGAETERLAELAKRIDPRQGVASAASATEMGDFFQYAIDKPVTLPRQKSAMLPIVNQDVQASRVSIYNQSVHGKFPLLGLKFKNTSGLHLMQGPITVFEGGNYAGDSRIMDLQPNEERLLSYAIDLGTEVEPVVDTGHDNLIAVKVNKGIVYATHKIRESRHWNIKNRSEHDRTIIVEHPYRQEFALVKPEKASERARDVYRFEVKAPSGQTVKQEVIEERDVVQTVQLTNSDDDTMRFFLQQKVVSEKVKQALEKAVELKTKWNGTQRQLAELQKELKAITDDQDRLRKNLAATPPTAAAYKRYLEKFDKQETEIENIQDNVKKMSATEQQQRGEYEAYLANLDVE